MTRRKMITTPRCAICKHARRVDIEVARISGVRLDDIARTYGVSRDMVWRHTTNHITPDQRAQYLADVDMKGLAARANAENLSVLDYLAITRNTLMLQMQAAAGFNDRVGTASLAGKLVQTLQAIGHITGEMIRLSPGVVVNNTAVFVNSPMFVDLQTMLMRKLQGHPAALSRVVEGLQELEAKAAPISNGAATIGAGMGDAHAG